MGNKHSSSKNSLKKSKSFKDKVQTSKDNLKQLFQLAESLDSKPVTVSSYPMNTNGDFAMNTKGPIVLNLHQTNPTTTTSTNIKEQKNTINEILLNDINQQQPSTKTVTTIGGFGGGGITSTPITPHLNEQMKRDLLADMFTSPTTPQPLLNIDLDQVNQNAPIKPKSQHQQQQNRQPQQEDVDAIFFDPRSPTVKRNPITKDGLLPFEELNKFMDLSPLNLHSHNSNEKISKMGKPSKDAILVLSNTRHNVIDILDSSDIHLLEEDQNVVTSSNVSLFDEDDDLIKKVFVLPSPIQPYDPNGVLNSNSRQQKQADCLELSFDKMMDLHQEMSPPPALSNNVGHDNQQKKQVEPIIEFNDLELLNDGLQLVLEDDFGLEAIDIINLDLELRSAGSRQPMTGAGAAMNMKMMAKPHSSSPKLLMNNRQRDIPSSSSSLRTPKRKNSLNYPLTLKGYASPSPLQNALAQHNEFSTSNLSGSTTTTTHSNNTTPYMTPKTPTNNDEENSVQHFTSGNSVVVSTVKTPKKTVTATAVTINKENVMETVSKKNGKMPAVHKNVKAVKKADQNDLRAKTQTSSIQRLDVLGNISNRAVR